MNELGKLFPSALSQLDQGDVSSLVNSAEDQKALDRPGHHSTFVCLNLFYQIREKQTFLDLLEGLRGGLDAMQEDGVGG